MILLPAGLRDLLRGSRFRQLLATRIAGQTGDGVFQIALASFIIFSPDHQTSAAKIAAGFATLLLPYSVIGPFAGVFIDRWRRQRILKWSNVLRAALVAIVAVVVAAGVQGPLFYVTALSVVSVNRFVLSALSASLPHVVREDQLVTANSLSTTLGTVTAVVGAGAGLGVRALIGSSDRGVAIVAIVAVLPYLLAAFAATRMPPQLLGPDADVVHAPLRHAVGAVGTGIRAGAAHVRRRRDARMALAAIGAHRFFYAISTVSTLLLYRNYQGFTDHGWIRTDLDGLGHIVAASSVGVLLAAALTPAAARRLGKPAWIVACFALAALVQSTLAATYVQEAYLAAALLLGFAAQGSKICVDTIVQETIDDEFRGRVFAFYDIVFNVAFVAAAALSAALLPPDGKSYAVLSFIAAGYALTAVAYHRGGRPNRAAAGSPPRARSGRARGVARAGTPAPHR